jgi:ligand-binding SRPBCC domain-containing protein
MPAANSGSEGWGDEVMAIDIWSAATTSPQRVMRMHRETLVQAPLDEAFDFFADASNLERLTPPSLRFSIRSARPLVMRVGLEIEYLIHLYGVPLRWMTVIDVWEPGVRFVDRQVSGPYVWWRHEHRFEAAGDATRVLDDVEYLPRVAWITRPFVAREVQQIFDYRERALRAMFDTAPQ